MFNSVVAALSHSSVIGLVLIGYHRLSILVILHSSCAESIMGPVNISRI
jgi:hypothetical protein